MGSPGASLNESRNQGVCQAAGHPRSRCGGARPVCRRCRAGNRVGSTTVASTCTTICSTNAAILRWAWACTPLSRIGRKLFGCRFYRLSRHGQHRRCEYVPHLCSVSYQYMKINGREVGEMGIDRTLCRREGVRNFAASDDKGVAEAEAFFPGIETIKTKMRSAGMRLSASIPSARRRNLCLESSARRADGPLSLLLCRAARLGDTL